MTWMLGVLSTIGSWLKDNWKVASIVGGCVIVGVAIAVLLNRCGDEPASPLPPKEVVEADVLRGQSLADQKIAEQLVQAAELQRDDSIKLLNVIEAETKLLEQRQRQIDTASLEELDEVFHQHGIR